MCQTLMHSNYYLLFYYKNDCKNLNKRIPTKKVFLKKATFVSSRIEYCSTKLGSSSYYCCYSDFRQAFYVVQFSVIDIFYCFWFKLICLRHLFNPRMWTLAAASLFGNAIFTYRFIDHFCIITF